MSTTSAEQGARPKASTMSMLAQRRRLGPRARYCMMIGGEPAVVKRLDPIFATLAPGPGRHPRTPGREQAVERPSKATHCGQWRRPFRQDGAQWYRIRVMAAYAKGGRAQAATSERNWDPWMRKPRRCAIPALSIRPQPAGHHGTLAARQRDWRRGCSTSRLRP